MPGARKFHRGEVNFQLRRTLDKGVRSGVFSYQSISFATGFPNAQIFSMQLHNVFPCSKLNLDRWRRVAEIAEYAGDPISREVRS